LKPRKRQVCRVGVANVVCGMRCVLESGSCNDYSDLVQTPSRMLPAMRFSRRFPLRSVCSPFRMAGSMVASPRLGRWVCVLAILAGQIGVPNFGLWLTAKAAQSATDGSEQVGCQCPPSLRRVGRCCCAGKSSSGTRSCCTKRGPSSCAISLKQKSAGHLPAASAQSTRAEQSLGYRNACPCGQGSGVDAYRCHDPRVLPPRLTVTVMGVSINANPLCDSHICGELLPPPVPPPEFALV